MTMILACFLTQNLMQVLRSKKFTIHSGVVMMY